MTRVADKLSINVDPEVMGGVPVFAGTGVPVSALLENIEAGVTLEKFLDNFPTVTLKQINGVLATTEFHHDLAIANRVMEEDREVLDQLAQLQLTAFTK